MGYPNTQPRSGAASARNDLRAAVGEGMGIGAAVVGHEVALAADDVFVSGEAFEANGAAGVDFAGADADLGSEAEAEAVGEAGAGVEENGGGVDLVEEAGSGGGVRGADSLGVGGAVLVDVVDSLVEGVYDAEGEGEVAVFGVPIFHFAEFGCGSLDACLLRGRGLGS